LRASTSAALLLKFLAIMIRWTSKEGSACHRLLPLPG
jgi:hypothetical protein